MPFRLERRLLQIAVAVAGIVPVTAGFNGIIGGLHTQGGFADSHYRYLSGLLLGIGAAFWSTIGAIERKGEIFRVLTVIVVIGGLARLGAALAVPGGSSANGALIMELCVTPLLCLWRERIERMDEPRAPGYRGPWQ